MANPINKKLKYLSNSGESGEITLYDSNVGFAESYLPLEVDGAIVYASLGEVTDENASPIKIEKTSGTFAILKMFKEKSVLQPTTVTVDMTNSWWTCPEGVNNIIITEIYDGDSYIFKVTPNEKYKFKWEYFSEHDDPYSEQSLYVIKPGKSEKLIMFNQLDDGEGYYQHEFRYTFEIEYSDEINKMTSDYVADY